MTTVFEFTTADKPHAPILLEASIEKLEDGQYEYSYNLNNKYQYVGHAPDEMTAGMELVYCNSYYVNQLQKDKEEDIKDLSSVAALLEDALHSSVLYNLDKY